MRLPTFHHERELTAAGHLVIGVDEAGCGCLAGPVVAAAVHLPLDSRIGLIRDSKLLSTSQRERLLVEFRERGAIWAIGSANVEEIDRVNIRQATYLAMKRAIFSLLFLLGSSNGRAAGSGAALAEHKVREAGMVRPAPFGAGRERPSDRSERGALGRASVSARAASRPQPFALVDAWTLPNLPIPQRAIIHGDRLVKSIAAASIIAKVTRDRIMDELDQKFPQYGFRTHRGYATSQHRHAIIRFGLSFVHRLTFCTNIVSVRAPSRP